MEGELVDGCEMDVLGFPDDDAMRDFCNESFRDSKYLPTYLYADTILVIYV